MIGLTDAELEWWKESFAKDGVVYETDEEYRLAVSNLVAFFDVLIEMDLKQKRKDKPEDDYPGYNL